MTAAVQPLVRAMEKTLESRAAQRKSDAPATCNRELSQVTAGAYLLALAVSLGSCSASGVVQNWTSAPAISPAPDVSQPNYRHIVADSIKKDLPQPGTQLQDQIERKLKGLKWPSTQ